MKRKYGFQITREPTLKTTTKQHTKEDKNQTKSKYNQHKWIKFLLKISKSSYA